MPRRHSATSQSAGGNATGNHARANKAAAEMNAAVREKLAVELRMQGCDFDVIAERCGYTNRSGAYKAWKRAIQRIPRMEVDSARENMRRSYDAMRLALWPQVQAGKTWAIEAWLKVDERESKLFGYDVKVDAGMSAQMVVIGVPKDVAEAV